jgi:hypothetical protein
VRRVLILLLCALLLPACGSKSKRLSREEYARRADAICARENRAAPTPTGVTSAAAFVTLADRTLPILDRALADLRRLEPPEDEQVVVDRWLSQLRRGRADSVAIRNRAKANDLGEVRALVQPALRRVTAANRLATRLGMHVCNQKT